MIQNVPVIRLEVSKGTSLGGPGSIRDSVYRLSEADRYGFSVEGDRLSSPGPPIFPPENLHAETKAASVRIRFT